MVGPENLDSSRPAPPSGGPLHDDLAEGVGDADDGVHKLPLHEHPALDLQTQPDEERRCSVEFPVGNAEALARKLPGARLHVLDSASTATPQAAANDVATAMLAL